jgi:ATP-binding cassette subfamily B protein
MLIYSWKLALVTLSAAPFFFLIFLGFNKLNKKYMRKIMEKSADLESHLVESLNAIITIKRFGLEDFANLKTENRFVRLLKDTYSASFGAILTGNGLNFVSTGITIAVLWVGSTFVIDKSITPGTLMMFYAIIGYVLSPLQSLISSNQQLQDANIAAQRLFQIMDLEQEESDGGKIELESDMMGDITFEDVAFRYGTRKDVFDGLNLTIHMGEPTAIIGESGSGKTTMMSILQHIYPVNEGRILIGKYDISQISNSSLRKHVGSVPQQIELFQGTVLENIAVGDLNPDVRKVTDLISELGLDDFIKGLPNGVNTYIGEHGASLSGGERQRIAIARALYKEPDIIIFDEATSSLDTMSERYVKRMIAKLASLGKTVISIAHRFSTIKDAKHIILLAKGKVVAEGTHQELLKTSEDYRKLWSDQNDEID